LINRLFPRQYIHVVQGEADVSRRLLQQRSDGIFFTGGTAVGRKVMTAAAAHLTPVTLELGGKCPCVVCDDAELDLTARRIAWGKFLNAGQTCLAPDYVLAHGSVIEPLIEALRRAIDRFYGPDAQASDDYGRIVNHQHFERLAEMLKTGLTVVGGQTDARDLYIAPTVLTDVSMDGPLMQDEIFGPILPVLAYSNLDDAVSIIRERSSPLAVYLFTHDRAMQNELIRQTRSGSVCVNDTVVQATGCDLPFGGVGDSGMGRYHGKASFDCFSYPRTIMRRRTWMDPGGRYPPARMRYERFRSLYNLFNRI
jgi:acyl-CoA reductase-like NAD-dependent aldehyde dehydrogenase